MPDKLIINAEYNLETENGYLQVGINDGSNKASINDDGSLNTNNFDTFSLLNRVLKELKIMNIHMSLMTDSEIKHTEVE